MSDDVGSAMKLRLKIRNVPVLDNGVPSEIELDQRGLIIGRSATADWSLPDPRSYISSRHCEITYRQGRYQLVDTSTNGTFLNGGTDRVQQPRDLSDGDVIAIGHYEVVATLIGGTASGQAMAAAPAPGWQGWGPSEPVAPPNAGGWDAPAPMPAISGQGAMSGHWAPPQAAAPAPGGWDDTPAAPAPATPDWGAPTAARSASGGWGEQPAGSWGAPVPSPSAPASGWSSPVPDTAPAPSTNDVWGRLADTNVVDWARGGFGQAAPAPPVEVPLGLGQPQAGFGALPVSAPMAAPPPAPVTPPVPPAARGGAGLAQLLSGAGLSGQDVKLSEGEALSAAGALLRRLVAGLVVMLEARARAKAQLGTQSTSLEFDGNNPIKFARTPEQALAQLLNPAERGFMPAERAVEDAFLDLQAHQVATLKAMQGALRATLDRFSPTAIRKRAEGMGLLQRILPGARDAALWQAYEKEFGGVAQGSDEAFMDVFAKEFKRAYEEQAKRSRR